MKNYLFAISIIPALTFGSLAIPALPDLPELPSLERKIIIFKEGVNLNEAEQLLSGLRGAELGAKLASVNGLAASLSSGVLAKLASDPRVARIDDDVIVYALSHRTTATIQSQTLPWGIDKIDADLVWPTGNTADTVKVAVLDTGISKKHPDLKANLKGGINTTPWWKSNTNYDDGNGHGSHVAGIIAAIDNTAGVVGAAHQADLYAVKVLSNNGSGYLSDIIEGIDWAITNGMQVINMSLGTTSDIQSFHDAVIDAYNAGITIVAAAGNNGGAVNYPGAYDEVIGVSATDSSDTLASWSSRGPEVDVSAPGVSIYSTYKGTGYATLSGTSMASPHVAGAAALLISSGLATTPADVRLALMNTALDLGEVGFDNLYGAGRVNAAAAVGL